MLIPMIIGEIRRYLRDNNTIRVSRSVRDLAYRALTAREALSRSMARDPDTDDIVMYLNAHDTPCQKEEVIAALEAIVEPMSLYEPVYSDSSSSETLYVMDQISDDGNTDAAWIENIALREALTQLTPREKMIVDLRFFRGKTQMEIASEIGISQAQVSRLEKGAIERMRRYL